MDIWKIESNPVSTKITSWAAVIVGLIFVIGFKNYNDTDTMSGFLLGVLILIIGIASSLMGLHRVVIVNPKIRQIIIEDTTRFGKKNRIIPFKDVVNVYIDEQGDTDGGSISYDVALDLKTGSTLKLFGAGMFDGRYDKLAMTKKCDQLKEYINTK